VIEDWKANKSALVAADIDRSFSADVKLSKIGVAVNRKLEKLRNQMLIDDPVIVTAPHYEKLDSLFLSKLYKCFLHMPKPAVHHTHLTACAEEQFLIMLTYNDFVYYSEKDNLFYTNQKGCDLPGYLPVNVLR
jgi:uncharacterized FlgJ-related protein